MTIITPYYKSIFSCVLSNGANTQTISSGSLTNVDFSSIVFDPKNMGSIITNSITIRLGGIYAVSFSVAWGLNTAGYRSLSVAVNGTVEYTESVKPVDLSSTYQTSTFIYKFNANDVITLKCFQNSGGGLFISGTLDKQTRLVVSLIAEY